MATSSVNILISSTTQLITNPITSVIKSSTISSSLDVIPHASNIISMATIQHPSFTPYKDTSITETVLTSLNAFPFLATSNMIPSTLDPDRPPSTLSKARSTPTIVFQGQDSRENNPVIIIAAVIFPILLLLLIVGIILTTCIIVYHQRRKKSKSNLAVLNDDNNSGHLSNPTYQSNTLNQTSTNVSKVPCDNISNPVYGGNIISIISIQ